jgi:hypothetical protein
MMDATIAAKDKHHSMAVMDDESESSDFEN